VAWKVDGADKYTAWSTDNNGNYIANVIGGVTGNSLALESLETTFHQDLNGDGVIGISSTVIGAAPAAPPSVTIGGPGNDTFIFHSGFGADVIDNFGSQDMIELDGFTSIADGNQLARLLNDAQTGQPQSLFQSVNDGHDTVINLGNHDVLILANVNIADLDASHFIIHP
jgi:hypothetical protein